MNMHVFLPSREPAGPASSNGRSASLAVAFLLVCLTIHAVPVRAPVVDRRELGQKFTEVWKTSEATRKKYSWKAGMEVIRDGKVVQVLVEELSFGSNGRQVRKVISNSETPLPSTFLVRQIAEDQKAKIVTFMGELRNFLEQYALTDDARRDAFFATAGLGIPDANGQFLVSGTDVFAPGDELKWWIDSRFYTITRATIATTFKGTRAYFSATYYYLPGLNYMARATIRIPSKDLEIRLRFYDFTKTDTGLSATNG